MQTGKFNILLDAYWGSSAKGKVSTWLADHFGIIHVSSANQPNAGHTAVFEDGTKFVAKAIPTAAILKKTYGMGMQCFISPGSGFGWNRLIQEWQECDQPTIYIHSRASIVTPEHAKREREGSDSTKHIASTMQGSGAAIADKVLRKPDVLLAGTNDFEGIVDAFEESEEFKQQVIDKIHIIDGMEFRNLTHTLLEHGNTFLHEGSQGYALSIDHGSHFPMCTSRNCSVQAAIDFMAIPPQLVGDVYLNLRSYPIRVGNVVENGVQLGYSGDFYLDCKEMTWEEVAQESGMPPEEAVNLAERERTTVTKRVRRPTNFSFIGLKDAVRTNGATKLILNFMQYINWSDNKLRDFNKLSKKSRDFIDKIEQAVDLPIVLIGTGPLHTDVIAREELL